MCFHIYNASDAWMHKFKRVSLHLSTTCVCVFMQNCKERKEHVFLVYGENTQMRICLSIFTCNDFNLARNFFSLGLLIFSRETIVCLCVWERKAATASLNFSTSELKLQKLYNAR
jgi:hypothetical protein